MARKPKPAKTYKAVLALDKPLDVTVTYNYSPATPDVHYLPNGDPGYPGDPAEVEILTITAADGTAIIFEDLPQKVQDALTEEIGLHAEEELREDDERRADYLAEQQEWEREHRDEIKRAIKEQ